MGLNKEYAEEMSCHDYGYALYHPVKSSALYIGDIGYFNEQGFWNRIGNITDAASLAKFNLKPIDVSLLDKAPPDDTIEWGPLLANHVKGKRLNASAEASGESAGIPVSASFQVEYTSSKEFGAILACLAPIRREAYYFSDPFKAWASSNLAALTSSAISNDLKEHGLAVITQTYATRKYTLTAWKGSDKSACIGFDVDAQGGAAINAESAWFEGRSVNGWTTDEAKGPDNNLRVVFASGVFCTFKKHFWSNDLSFTLRGENIEFEDKGTLPQPPKQGNGKEDEDW